MKWLFSESWEALWGHATVKTRWSSGAKKWVRSVCWCDGEEGGTAWVADQLSFNSLVKKNMNKLRAQGKIKSKTLYISAVAKLFWNLRSSDSRSGMSPLSTGPKCPICGGGSRALETWLTQAMLGWVTTAGQRVKSLLAQSGATFRSRAVHVLSPCQHLTSSHCHPLPGSSLGCGNGVLALWCC